MRVPHQLLMKCKAGQKNHIAGQKFKIAGHYLDVKILFGGQPTLMVNKCPGTGGDGRENLSKGAGRGGKPGFCPEFCPAIFFLSRYCPAIFLALKTSRDRG